uniref:Uncharacterized protein n=1 Tax=Cucumis melo TaxID=3656 RepID=A0A9I9E8B5_CUCME
MPYGDSVLLPQQKLVKSSRFSWLLFVRKRLALHHLQKKYKFLEKSSGSTNVDGLKHALLQIYTGIKNHSDLVVKSLDHFSM